MRQTESQIVPSTTVLHQAFFPPRKSPWVQLLWWAAGGLANVMLTMVAYKLILDEQAGTLATGLSSWKWMHIICAAVTFVVFVPLVIFVSQPYTTSDSCDSPLNPFHASCPTPPSKPSGSRRRKRSTRSL